MKKTQNTKNKILAYRLVKDYFCLEKESLGLFKHRLFYEPHVNPMYKKIIGNSPDLRRKVLIDESFISNLEEIDEGWQQFRDIFRFFVMSTCMKYEDFSQNKVTYKGQRFKIKKALVDYAMNNLDDMSTVFAHHEFKNLLFEEIQELKELRSNVPVGMEASIEYGDKKNIKVLLVYRDSWRYEKHNLLTIPITDNKKILLVVEKYLKNIFEEIGKYKIPNKKLYLVLSLNFMDWFLCSTGEGWSSCLSLESDYEGGYWHGLPGLIGDKNRALLYITDGKQKEYNGIKIDRFICRSWVLTVRKKIEDKKYENLFLSMHSYPVEFNIEKMAENFFGMSFIEKRDYFTKGRYYFELLYHETRYSDILFQSFIYGDRGKFKLATRNKTKYFYGKYAYYKDGQEGYNPYTILKSKKLIEKKADSHFSIYEGLSGIKKHEMKDRFYISDNEDEEEYEEEYA